MAAIKIHAGDFMPMGQNSFSFGAFNLWPKVGGWSAERIPMSAVESVEIASEASVKRIGGTVGWGVAGAALLGPAGLLAGLLLGGRKQETTFVCQLKDGRKFLATIESKEWPKILAAKMEADRPLVPATPMAPMDEQEVKAMIPAAVLTIGAIVLLVWSVWDLVSGGGRAFWLFIGFGACLALANYLFSKASADGKRRREAVGN